MKGLRYKDYDILHSGPVNQGQFHIGLGNVKEFDSMKDLVQDLTADEVLDWWRIKMGFVKSEDQS